MSLRAEKARENGKLGGRPKGKKNQATLEREAVLKAMQQRIMQAGDILLDRLFHNALGHSYLFKIEKYWETVKNKKGESTRVLRCKPPKRVTAENEIREYLVGLIDEGDLEEEDDTYYYITTKDPDTRAIELMLNRTFGNSVQPVQMTDPNGKSVFDNEAKTKSDTAIKHFLKSKK
jgi:hypothetical protein